MKNLLPALGCGLLLLSACGAFTPAWEEDYKRQFVESCLQGEGVFHTDPKAYCDCALEKTLKRYPDPGDYVNRKDSAAYIQELRTCPR